MSLGIVIKGPEGLVLAADSRVTIATQMPDGTRLPVSFDNARKLLNFQEHRYVGAVTYGLAGIGLRTAYSFLPEFEADLQAELQSQNLERLSVGQFAERLSIFFMRQWNAVPPPPPPPPGAPPQNITFLVAGFNEREPYGEVYLIEIPNCPNPMQHHPAPTFGMTWGGQREIVDRLLRGFDERVIGIFQQAFTLNPEQLQHLISSFAPLNLPIPIQFLSLQDCIDLAIFFIRTTIEAQRLTVGVRGVGGAIDIATITRREGFGFVQEKEITGECIPSV
jgi:hypothetical protein